MIGVFKIPASLRHTATFGLLAGRLVDASSVKRGLACGCVCPQCHSPLIAKQGEVYIHHFAHHNRRACDNALVASILFAARQELSESTGGVTAKREVEYGMERISTPGREVDWQVELVAEKWPVKHDGLEPDLVVTIASHRMAILIEIASRVFPASLSLHYKKRNLPCMVISLNAMLIQLVDYQKSISLEALHRLLLWEPSCRYWLWHPKVDELRDKLVQRTREQYTPYQWFCDRGAFPTPVQTTMQSLPRERSSPSGWTWNRHIPLANAIQNAIHRVGIPISKLSYLEAFLGSPGFFREKDFPDPLQWALRMSLQDHDKYIMLLKELAMIQKS
ncbi:competence protein CoiA family protein [Chromobacterium haemolyticum]|uniref:competence protein CoiA family protein n=1 Tax=Chromobacterium haemolyticum TaxID=394935 RepID=UPI001747133F|nr:competence protein CoiA family protein [Chromobacterium haemolyticum]QOD82943.1 hypothetical protein IEZ30_00075 [Chromobacterium haemolyticum]